MDNTSVRANAPGNAPGQATLLTAPAPELESLSFALAEPESVSEWISRLPMANVSETAGQIRQATFEIARLDTDFGSRMRLLEGIRPTVLYLAARLDKAANSAGNQADAISRLAQRLQMNLCSGYRAVVLAALPSVRKDDGATDELIRLARIHTQARGDVDGLVELRRSQLLDELHRLVGGQLHAGRYRHPGGRVALSCLWHLWF